MKSHTIHRFKQIKFAPNQSIMQGAQLEVETDSDQLNRYDDDQFDQYTPSGLISQQQEPNSSARKVDEPATAYQDGKKEAGKAKMASLSYSVKQETIQSSRRSRLTASQQHSPGQSKQAREANSDLVQHVASLEKKGNAQKNQKQKVHDENLSSSVFVERKSKPGDLIAANTTSYEASQATSKQLNTTPWVSSTKNRNAGFKMSNTGTNSNLLQQQQKQQFSAAAASQFLKPKNEVLKNSMNLTQDNTFQQNSRNQKQEDVLTTKNDSLPVVRQKHKSLRPAHHGFDLHSYENMHHSVDTKLLPAREERILRKTPQLTSNTAKKNNSFDVSLSNSVAPAFGYTGKPRDSDFAQNSATGQPHEDAMNKAHSKQNQLVQSLMHVRMRKSAGVGQQARNTLMQHPQEIMPRIFVHKTSDGKTVAMSSNFNLQQMPGSSTKIAFNGNSVMPTEHSQLFNGLQKKQTSDKKHMIGKPYLVKNKMPFYDAHGVFVGQKLASGLSMAKVFRKLNMYDKAYNSSLENSYRMDTRRGSKAKLATHAIHHSEEGRDECSECRILRENSVNEFNQKRASARVSARSSEVEMGTESNRSPTPCKDKSDLGPKGGVQRTEQSIQVSKNDDKCQKHGSQQNRSSYDSIKNTHARVRQVSRPQKPPSIDNFNLKIQEDGQENSQKQNVGQLQRIGSHKKELGTVHSSQKHVREQPFVELVSKMQVDDEYSRSSQKQQAILAVSQINKQSGSNLKDSLKNKNSLTSLISAEHGKLNDMLTAKNAKIEQLRQELQIKDRLMQKLLEDDDQSDAVTQSQLVMQNKSASNIILKLKEEVDLAQRILAQRDSEITQLKKQAKTQAYQQCNEERLQYMNECIRLQQLLKVYGGPQLRRKFKGLRVSQVSTEQQSLANQRLHGRTGSFGSSEDVSKSRSPTAKVKHNFVTEVYSSKDHTGHKPQTSIQVGNTNLTYFDEKHVSIANTEYGEALAHELNSKVKYLEDLIEKLSQDRNQLETSCNKLKSENLGLEQTLQEKLETVCRLEQQNEEHLEENSKLQAQIKGLKKHHAQIVVDKHEAIDSLRSHIADENYVDQIKQDHDNEILKRKLELERVVDQNKSEIERIVKEHELALAGKSSEIQRLSEEIDKLNRESMQAREQQFGDLQKKLEGVQAENETLQGLISQGQQLAGQLQLANESVELKKSELDEVSQTVDDLRAKVAELERKIEQQRQEIDQHKLQVESLKRQVEAKGNKNSELEDQMERLKQESARSEAKQTKRDQFHLKQSIAPLNDEALQEQICELEIQNGEYEVEIEQLRKQVEKLNSALQSSKEGMFVIENLEDKKNFANLISRQGTLVEKLEQEKKRASDLEKIIAMGESVDAGTQTMQTLLVDNSRVIIERSNESENGDMTDEQFFVYDSNKKEPENTNLNFEISRIHEDNPIDVSSQVEVKAGETLEAVQQDIEWAEANDDKDQVKLLKRKEHVLLKKELKSLQASLLKKNELINVTLENQEKLSETMAMQKNKLSEQEEQLARALENSLKQSTALEAANKSLEETKLKLEALASEKQKSDHLSMKRLKGLEDVVIGILQEQFQVYKVTDEQNLADMLEIEPERVLKDQFLIPRSAQRLLDSSANGIFKLLNKELLIDVSMTDLQRGFKKMKQALDRKNENYKVLIFELDEDDLAAELEQEAEKDADEVRLQVSSEMLKAIPLMKEEFVEKLVCQVFDEIKTKENEAKIEKLASLIALGCQQVARSVCFVHYWAFNSLWLTFNCDSKEPKQKKSIKRLLEQAELEKLENKKLIEDLNKKNFEEAEKAKRDMLLTKQEAENIRKQAQDEAKRIKREAEEEAERAKLEFQKQQQLAEQREKRLAEEAKLREAQLAEEAKQREIELAEQAKRKEQELAEQAQQREKSLAEEAKRREKELALQAKLREQKLEESARRREQELIEQHMSVLPGAQDEIDGEDGDREGFSLEVYRFIKRNQDLNVIVNIANASLYSIRTNCNVFSVDSRRLSGGKQFTLDDDEFSEPPFVSMTVERDSSGFPVLALAGLDHEEEVIYRSDFYGKVLMSMGLKRYIDIPEQTAKLDNLMSQIGAMATDTQSLGQTRFIRLEVLISAMRIHKYEYAGLNLATKLQGVDFRSLSAKSARIMNRLTRICAQYQDKYQQKAKEGVQVTIQQIVQALFKDQIETQLISKSSVINSLNMSLNASQLNESTELVRVQMIPQDKFYIQLLKFKIKKDSREVANLSNFLRLSQESPDKIMVKKLIRVIEEFLRNHYLKSFGYKKKRLDDSKPGHTQVSKPEIPQDVQEQAEEYYYYEEDPAETAKDPSANNRYASDWNRDNLQKVADKLNNIGQSQAAADEEEEEYYYDEEQDAADGAQQPQQQERVKQKQGMPPSNKQAEQSNDGYEYYYDEEEPSARNEKAVGIHSNTGEPLKFDNQRSADRNMFINLDAKKQDTEASNQLSKANRIDYSKLNQTLNVNDKLHQSSRLESSKNLGRRSKFANSMNTSSMKALPAPSIVSVPQDSQGYRGEAESDSKYRSSAAGDAYELELDNDKDDYF